MIQLKKTNLWLLGLFILVAACSHGRQDSQNLTRSLASSEARDLQQDRIQTMLANRDVPLLNTLFHPARTAQILVSSLDERIQHLVDESEADRLFGSNIYCRLWSLHEKHTILEQKIKLAMILAIQAGPETEAWLLEQMVSFARRDPAAQASMIQMLRFLVGEEVEICGTQSCMRARVEALVGLSVPPLDDEKFSAFMHDYRSEIAMYSAPSAADLKPGSCSSQWTGRVPSSASKAPAATTTPTKAYDWSNRNWVGAVLPDGQFVFTYDDGPHPKYTQQIMDTWEHSGFPKSTFFWLNDHIQTLPDLVSAARRAGYQIGSHSKRHGDLGNLAKAGAVADLNAVNLDAFVTELKSVTAETFLAWKNQMLDVEINQAVQNLRNVLSLADPGYVMQMYRLPYGSGVRNDLIGARFQTLNLEHFFWRVDSLDWQDKNPLSIRDRAVAEMKAVKKGVVLFHDIHPQSVAAAQLMVDALKENNWKAVSVTSLVPEKRNE